MTHKKLILMALMGVMLSDADAGAKKISSNALKSSRNRASVGSFNAKTNNPFGGLDGAGEAAGNDAAAPAATQGAAPAEKAEELLDLDVTENLSQVTKALLNTPKDVMTRGELLEKVTGKRRSDNSLKGQGNLLDAWAAIGEDNQAMGQYLATRDVVNFLNAFANKQRVDGSGAFVEGTTNDDIRANWAVSENATVSMLDNTALANNGGNLESLLHNKYNDFFDALEKVKFATADGLVDFPAFSRAEMTINEEVLGAVTHGNALRSATGHAERYTRIMRPVEKAWKETATNAIKAVQKLAVAEKEKGKTLFLPQLTDVNAQGQPVQLEVERTGNMTQVWQAGSTTAGIKGAATGGGDMLLKLVSVKPGEKKAFLKMDALLAPQDNDVITGTTITANAVVTDNGVKLLKKMSDFYKKSKGKRAAFNPDAWQQKISSFTVAEQKIIDAYNAELAKKASGPDFKKAKTKLEDMLNRKTADGLSFAALGGKFARSAAEDSGAI